MGQRDRMFKVLVVGDATVGKTSLVQRYAHDSFNRHYKSTVGGERGGRGPPGGGRDPGLRWGPARPRPRRPGWWETPAAALGGWQPAPGARPVPNWCQTGAKPVTDWCQASAKPVTDWCQAGAKLVPNE